METKHKTKLKERHELEAKKFLISVENMAIFDTPNKKATAKVTSQFESIEEFLHKIELDLFTYIHLELTEPIKIKVEVLK